MLGFPPRPLQERNATGCGFFAYPQPAGAATFLAQRADLELTILFVDEETSER